MTEEVQGEIPLLEPTRGGDHGVPRDVVPVGDFVEHVARAVEVAALAVHVDEGVGDGGDGGGVAEFDDVGVDLFPEVKVVDAGGGFQDGGEGEVVGGYAGGDHVGVGGDGFVEGGGLGLEGKVVDPCGRRTGFCGDAGGVGGGECGGWRRRVLFGSGKSVVLQGRSKRKEELGVTKIGGHFNDPHHTLFIQALSCNFFFVFFYITIVLFFCFDTKLYLATYLSVYFPGNILHLHT